MDKELGNNSQEYGKRKNSSKRIDIIWFWQYQKKLNAEWSKETRAQLCLDGCTVLGNWGKSCATKVINLSSSKEGLCWQDQPQTDSILHVPLTCDSFGQKIWHLKAGGKNAGAGMIHNEDLQGQKEKEYYT